MTGKAGLSQFDRDSNKILDIFTKFRSDIPQNKQFYLAKFSPWSKLANEEKSKHSLGSCQRCFDLHSECQSAFPLKPKFQPEPVVTIDHEALQRQGFKKFATNVMTELDRVFRDNGSTSFADVIDQTRSIGLEKRKSRNEKRKERRRQQKDITTRVNEHFADKAAITLLTEGESKRKYHRKRLAQSYYSPEVRPPNPKKKKHSPNFSNVSWDTEQLQSTLENWPTGVPINWSAVGKAHGIQGGNAGQIAKEFAETLEEVDVQQIMSSTPSRKPTVRPCKRRLPGCDVAIPRNPLIHVVEAEIKSMISSGRFMLGEECTPFKITKYTPVNGVMTPHDVFIHARKVSLRSLRQRLLQKQVKYMRLTPTSEVESMTRVQLTERLTALDCDGMSREELCQQLINFQRSRSLCMWHDHATILKMGFIMITVHIMYDPIIFYTDEEFQQLNPGASINIQSEVEQPEIHLLSLGSSSVQDQAALTGDRIGCLLDLSNPVQTEDGEKITDTLRFFTGDHPATQFEQGTKQGGTFKCGACGCNEQMFDDQAHSLVYKWRSLHELQSLATGGRFGKQAGMLHPFELKVDGLRAELGVRGVCTNDMLRDDLQKCLEQTLLGVIRVPALLLTNPTQSLASLNLERYEVVASEPLHDIKGQIVNLITELPYHLPPGETKTKCTHLISCCLSKEKKSGADLRRVIIQVYLLLKDLDCSSKVRLLLQSVIKIGQIAYSFDAHRSPRQLLQLYNACWMHMELCRYLFCFP